MQAAPYGASCVTVLFGGQEEGAGAGAAAAEIHEAVKLDGAERIHYLFLRTSLPFKKMHDMEELAEL